MNRFKAYFIIVIPYIIGCAAGWFIFLRIAPDNENIFKILVGLLAADVCATVIVWVFGLIFKNSSFYDPYWSLIPFLIILSLMLRFSLWSAAAVLFIISLSIWSWRLTVNWAYTCKNIKTEDWRYSQYRTKNKPFMWHLINLFGINLVPTVIVFIALIPAVYLVLLGKSIDIFNILGALIILIGTYLETIVDISMHKFLKNSAIDGKLTVHNKGLRKYSRHPNYFGEIMIWIGVYVSAFTFAAWWFAGIILMVLLFVFISIPLAEKRQLARRPDYAEYRENTRMLLPFPKRKG